MKPVPTFPHMKSIFIVSLSILTLPSTLHAAVILQRTGQTYVKFDAGSYFNLSNSGTSQITDNGDGTLSTSLRDDSDTALLTYRIDFETTGEYYLYFNATAPNASSDSLYLVSDFDTSPTTSNSNQWNNLQVVGTEGWAILNGLVAGSGVEPTDSTSTADLRYNNRSIADDTETYSLVSAANPVEIRFRPREAGLIWNSFVLSTESDLTATELNNLSPSAIPEPSTLILFGFSSLLLLLNKCRYSS